MVASRAQANALIDEGRVLVGGSVADKPSRLVASYEPVELERGPARYVSRGGRSWPPPWSGSRWIPSGLRVLDAGASTGGFTDCLLQAGAESVVAVDVGHGQLAHRLRLDPRVVSCENLDIRDVTLATVGGVPVDMATVDLSFISVVRAIPVLVGEAVCAGGPLVMLVKPQFEAGRVEASRARGVIRDPAHPPANHRDGGRRAHRGRSSHHGGDAFSPQRIRRQRRVLGLRPFAPQDAVMGRPVRATDVDRLIDEGRGRGR